MIDIIQSNEPEQRFEAELKKFLHSNLASHCFALSYSYKQNYLLGGEELELLALVLMDKTQSSSSGKSEHEIHVFVTNDLAIKNQLDTLAQDDESDKASIRDFCIKQNLAWINLANPLRLEVVKISKPWGQEIWYTGIEERGQSKVIDNSGNVLPLPWLFSLASGYLLSQQQNLILLKILDPLPRPNFGDLYFEMHEEKQEVYVVTHVDPKAWPNGEGGIRFGFDQGARRNFDSDEGFKSAYALSVKKYRAVRKSIDALIDAKKQKQGIALDQALELPLLEKWLAEIPEDLQAEEKSSREEMEKFIHVAALRLGDVVKVPLLTPHSLLHGVRTIEFQTPVYERKILSFGQKVLTQNHWDTEEALEKINLEPKALANLTTKIENDNVIVEEIVSFDDFIVDRITMLNETNFDYVCDFENYHLVIGVSGSCSVDGTLLSAEEALLLGAGSTNISLLISPAANSGDAVIVLVARPR